MTSDEAYAFRADGKVFQYRLVGGGWVADADTPDVLVQTGGGWILTTRTDDIETYDSEGHLISIKTRSGRTTTLAYSDGSATPPNGGTLEGTTLAVPPGLLMRVVDFRGRALQFSYGASGSISKVTDPAGNIYAYLYDGNGNLQTTTYPDAKVRTYHYNESANTSGANLLAHLTGITDENNIRFATYKYNINGLAIYSGHAGNADVFSFDNSWA